MKEQLLASKLRMPNTVCNAINRQELLERIHQMPEPVIVLHAGTGYGKTTVMAEYFHTYKLPCGWYHLGRTDDDINRFLYYFEALLREQLHQSCTHKEVTDWSLEAAESVVNQILTRLESWKGSLNIVLDNFQCIHNPFIFEFLRLFIQYMGNQIRIFLLIKGKFPGFLTRFVFQGRVGVLETKDLKITEEELIRHMQRKGTGLPSRKDVEQLLKWTEGWTVAVNYMLTHEPEGDENQGNLEEYLFYEIFRFLSPKQQVFMAESAILETMTPGVCRDILVEEDTEELLEYFVKQQLLTERTGRAEYRYHPILREFLQRQVEPVRREEIRKREGEYCPSPAEKQIVSYPALLHKKQEDRMEIATKLPLADTPLRLTCFGGIRIQSEEEQNLIHWRTRKTKEMFAYFWEQEERAVSKEEIMDALWQEGSGQRLESLFHTTLSYLKRAFSEIGISDLIQMDNKRYTMNKHWFSSDTQKLKQLYGSWKQGMDTIDVERESRELLSLYQGDYLEEVDGSWVMTSREFYQRLYLQCCELLVNQAGCMKQYDVAVRILEQAVKLDPYSDALNGMLMKNLCAMGEVQAAKQQYDRHNRLLKEELNVGIGRQVREIYQNTIVRRIG